MEDKGFRPKKRFREIGKKYRALTGRVNFSKDTPIHFESSLERDFIYLQEFNLKVKGFIEQPLKIEYSHNGRRLKYIPDFLVYYNQDYDQDELIEIKYSEDLRINKEKYIPRFEAALEFCEKNGLQFNIVTEKEIRSNKEYLDNLKFLVPYRNYFSTLPEEYTLEMSKVGMQIQDLVYKSNEKITVNKLIQNLSGKTGETKDIILFHLWVLVAENFIDCDLHRKISLETKLWRDIHSN